MNGKGCWLWLVLIACSALGCRASLPTPHQPDLASAYSVLTFPTSMRLLAFDDHAFDAPTRIDILRVTPGRHTMRFVHVNAGIDGSAEHAGQLAAPFTLDVQEGITYHFESKT